MSLHRIVNLRAIHGFFTPQKIFSSQVIVFGSPGRLKEYVG